MSLTNPTTSILVRKFRTFRTLSNQGRWERVRKLFYEYAYLRLFSALLFPIGSVVVFTLGLLEQYFNLEFRVYRWRSWRIGHQAADLEVFLRRREMSPELKKQRVLIITENAANIQLLKMARRKLTIVHASLIVRLFDNLKKAYPNTAVLQILTGVWQTARPYLDYTKSLLEFTEAEKKRGEKLLREIGVRDTNSFVCFHTRDKTYLQKATPELDFSYHDYRDCSIENYLLTAETLAKEGIWAIRVGAVVANPVFSSEPRVIDYASRYRSDFGDIYLATHCKFFLGTNCGITSVPNSFNVPVAWANVTPFGEAAWRHTDLFIPKKYFDLTLNRLLTFREIMDRGGDRWGFAKHYVEAKVQLVENSPEEICDLALEMNARIDGNWTPHVDDEKLQECFRALFGSSHASYGFTSKVGAAFLRKNRHLLD